MKMALRRKFKQCRQPLCSSQAVAEARAKFGRPGVAGRKRKSDAEGPPTVNTLIKKERLKLSGSCEMFEDDRSLRKHVESIKEEMRKRQPNTARIADKMKRTVEYRQRFCREKTTAEVLQEFPCLRMTAFLISDVQDTYGVQLNVLGRALLSVHERVLIEAEKRCKKYGDYVTAFRSLQEETVEQSKCDDAKLELTVKLLPSLFKEDCSEIFAETSEELQLIPQLHHIRDSWSISVDKQMISGSVTSFGTAVQAWYGTFWLLSVEYPARLSKTCEFFEHALLQRGGKMPAIVKTWANRLLR